MRYVKIGLEDTFGVAAGTFPYVLDPTRIGLDAPSGGLEKYAGASGTRMSRLVIPTQYIPQGSIEFGVPYDAIGLLLKIALGTWTSQGTAVGGGASTTLAANVAAAAGTIVVNDEAGFQAGDKIQLDDNNGDPEVVEIQALDGGAGPTYTWTLAAAVQKAHSSGDDVVEVTSPYTHKFRPRTSSTVDLPSATLKVGRELMEHIFVGCVANSLEFSVESAFLMCTAEILAKKDTKSAVDTSQQDFASALISATQNTFVGFRSGASEELTSYASQISLTMNNNVPAERAIRFGSRFPVKFRPGGFDLTGSFQIAFETLDEYTRFWGDSGGASDASVTKDQMGIDFVENVVDGWPKLSFNMPKVFLSSVAAEVSGRDPLDQRVEFEALYDPSVGWGTALIVELKNSVSRY